VRAAFARSINFEGARALALAQCDTARLAFSRIGVHMHVQQRRRKPHTREKKYAYPNPDPDPPHVHLHRRASTHIRTQSPIQIPGACAHALRCIRKPHSHEEGALKRRERMPAFLACAQVPASMSIAHARACVRTL
jgi:hypothetical protein